jgi:hypothetical protein
MITKRILNRDRIRRIEKGFGFIPHQFLKGGFLQTLSREEQLLYFFLVLVSDRNGISFYSFDSICNLIGLDTGEYLDARSKLIQKDLICFENNMYQVLSLPEHPVHIKIQSDDPATVRHMIMQSLQEDSNG